jgi:urease accessory protein
MIVITDPPRTVEAAALAGKARDTLRLAWEERRWTRKRVTTTGGREVALALPTGSVLEPGEILAVEHDWYLAVEGRPEPVLAIFPQSHEDALRIAFDVGNRHVTLAIDGDALVVPDEPAMTHLVARLGARWERRETVYTPLGGGGHE